MNFAFGTRRNGRYGFDLKSAASPIFDPACGFRRTGAEENAALGYCTTNLAGYGLTARRFWGILVHAYESSFGVSFMPAAGKQRDADGSHHWMVTSPMIQTPTA